MKKIIRSRSKRRTVTTAKSNSSDGKTIINRLHQEPTLQKQSSIKLTRLQAPGIVMDATGLMPADLEKSAREQENHTIAVGRRAQRRRAS